LVSAALDVVEAGGNKLTRLADDYASRMARAKEMGFDTSKTYYHGTGADFDSFREGYGGVYFSDSPEYANRYTTSVDPMAVRSDVEAGRNIIPANLGVQNTFDTRNPAHRKIYEEQFLNKWGNGTPLRDDGLPDWVEVDDFQEFFEAEGLPFDSAIVGEPSTQLPDGSFKPESSLLVTDESKIRSVNAQFDPAKSSSSNLLASGLAGTAIAGGLGSQEAEASFLGQGAKYADKFMLDIAQKMERSGIEPDEIWQKTGWGKGVDDKWRFEVSDDMAQLNVPEKASGKQAEEANQLLNRLDDYSDEDIVLEMELFDFKGTPEEYKAEQAREAYEKLYDTTKSDYPLESVLDHPDLMNADPSLKGIDTQFRNSWQSNKGASYTPSEDMIRIGREEADKGSAMLHEVQHATQQREGFARGGSPEMARFHGIDALSGKKGPYSKGYSAARDALYDMGRYGKADYIGKLNTLANSANPRPSSITNLSDFYQYSDEIRSKFGSMPNTKAKGRDEWLRSAAAFIRNKNVEGLDYYDEMLAKNAMRDPAEYKKKYAKAKRQFDKNSGDFKEYKGIDKEIADFESLEPYEQYKRLAGEVEARNVQARMNMTPAERRAKAPWLTEDVPRSQQIVRGVTAGSLLGAGGAQAYNPTTDTSQLSVGNYRPETYGQDNAKALRDLHNLEKGVEATYTAYGADAPQQPSHDPYNTDYGTIEPDEYPMLHQAGDFLEKYSDTPIGPMLGGTADYLRNFGTDRTYWQRYKDAFGATLDFM
jgi:hypothetical protein